MPVDRTLIAARCIVQADMRRQAEASSDRVLGWPWGFAAKPAAALGNLFRTVHRGAKRSISASG